MWAPERINPTGWRPRACFPASCWNTRDFTLHTGVRTFEAAAALRRYGAETERVRQLFDVTPSEYNAKAALVAAAQIRRMYDVHQW